MNRAHRSYRHEAVLYSGLPAFLAAVVPFVLDGLARQQPVMVAVIGSRAQALRAGLGDAADAVQFVDMAELGRNPARIIPAWREFVEVHCAAGNPARGVGEPIWAGRRDDEILECQFHEGLLNLAICPDTPLWLMCPYDVASLDESVIREAYRSHPVVVESDVYRGSTEYGGAYHVQNLFGRDLPEPAEMTDKMTFQTQTVSQVTEVVGGVATASGLSVDRSIRLASAVHEVAMDSVDHGGGEGALRIWLDGSSLVCEVRDHGLVTDPMVGRSADRTGADHRHGLWLANQLFDLVQIRSNSTGTTVRMHSWI